MDDDVHRLVGGQRRNACRINAFRVDNRDPRMYANNTQVVDNVQRADGLPKASGRQQERIAPGQNDFPYLRPRPNVVQCRKYFLGGQWLFPLADVLPPKTIAAVDWECLEELEQDAIGVAMDDSLDRTKCFVADRVSVLAGSVLEFEP